MMGEKLTYVWRVRHFGQAGNVMIVAKTWYEARRAGMIELNKEVHEITAEQMDLREHYVVLPKGERYSMNTTLHLEEDHDEGH